MNGQATKSYDIVVSNPEADFIRPLKVIYEWTGKGFVGGAKVTGNAVNMLSQQSNEYEFGLVLAPMAVGTAGGFVVGIADGIWKTAEEVGKVIIGKNERIVAFTTYEYDDRSRLITTHMYNREDPQQEVARTEYSYQDDALEPLKATIYSFPDGAIHVVEYSVRELF
jgi:YD repeat-containing protein